MIEQELIAAVLQRPNILIDCECEPQHFASEVHQQIWACIQTLQSEGKPFDTVTVMQTLGGDAAARTLEIVNDSVGVPANAADYARRVTEAWRGRVSADVYAQASAGEITRDEVIQHLMQLDLHAERFEATGEDALKWALADMESAADAGGKLRGITTGLTDLDRHLGGWHRGDLSVIGARPAQGKTALLLHHAQHCTGPLGFVSAEQPAYQIAQRNIAALGRVSLADLRQGRIGEREMRAVVAAKQRMQGRWHIYDRSSPTITEVERVARRWKHRHNITALYIDYIQRIRGIGDKRHEQVGDVVRRLKTLARDLDIPVVALAQVGRQVEARTNRRPSMGDLSDSSEIEKEADQVLTLYRDEVYDPESKDKGIAEIAIAKNRHGYTGTVKVAWMGEHVRFGDLAYGAAA